MSKQAIFSLEARAHAREMTGSKPQTQKGELAARSVLSYLSPPLRGEIERVAASRIGGIGAVSELRVSSLSASSVRFFGSELFLSYRVSRRELSELFRRITASSLYAYSDTVKKGYIPMQNGVRVGLVGHIAGGDSQISAGSVSSLVFRIPSRESELSAELYSAYLSSGGGVLIYSPPAMGKTSALRSLAASLGKSGRRVAIIDERCEFSGELFSGSSVDIVSGFSRTLGIEIAVRTLAPDVIIVDELMGDECRELLYAMRSGVPVIATVHAARVEEVYEKRELCELISAGVFRRIVGIFGGAGHRRLDITEVL